MTIISHRRKFIFVRSSKVAGTSVAAALAPLCGEKDVIARTDSGFRSGVDTDYFHIPRRADSNDAYGLVPQHALPDVIREKVGDKVWREYFKFTIVRNPWDMFVSHYIFRLHVMLPDIERRRIYAPALVRLLRGIHRLAAGETFMYVPPPEHFLRSRLVGMLEAGRRKESVEFAFRTGCFAAFLARAPQFYFCGGREYADYVIRFENLRRDFDEACRLMQLPRRVLPRTKNEVRPREHHYRGYYTDYSRAHVARTCRRIVDAFGYRFGG